MVMVRYYECANIGVIGCGDRSASVDGCGSSVLVRSFGSSP